MRAIILSRLIAFSGAVAAILACNDSMSPSQPNGGASGAGSGITVIPSSVTIQAGQVIALQARLRDEFGNRLTSFSWKSSNDAIATVAATGEVYGRSQGIVTVTASALGKAQSATVQVTSRPSKPNGKPDPQ